MLRSIPELELEELELEELELEELELEELELEELELEELEEPFEACLEAFFTLLVGCWLVLPTSIISTASSMVMGLRGMVCGQIFSATRGGTDQFWCPERLVAFCQVPWHLGDQQQAYIFPLDVRVGGTKMK